MIFLFRFDIKDNGIDFVLNDAISHDIDTGAYVDIELKMLPLVKSIAELLLPYRPLSISPTILNYEILDTNEQEVMLSKGLGIHILLPIKNIIFEKSQQLAALLIEVINRQTKLEKAQPEQNSKSGETLPETPIIHPLSMLPVISNLIYESFKGAKDQYENLIAAREKPYVLDDKIINRVTKLYTSDQEFVLIYKEQIAVWEKETLTLNQKKKITKLKDTLIEWDKLLKDILTLNKELSCKY